jgi:hypothetical protein
MGLNLANLLPCEPLDGGLICRALPYRAIVVFPLALAALLLHIGEFDTPQGASALALATLIALRRVQKWRRYARGLRARMERGDATALQEWQASFNVPPLVRLLVAVVYGLTLVGGGWMCGHLASSIY